MQNHLTQVSTRAHAHCNACRFVHLKSQSLCDSFAGLSAAAGKDFSYSPSLTGLLPQILALLAMEQPVTLSADDIRDEKVRVSTSSNAHQQWVLQPVQGQEAQDPKVLAPDPSTVLTACLMLLRATKGVCTGLHTINITGLSALRWGAAAAGAEPCGAG